MTQMWHIANLNIAYKINPSDDSLMHDFYANIDKVNQLADVSPGFIWRYKEDEEPLDKTIFFEDGVVVNFSVWKDVESLFDFTYKTYHAEIFKRKKEWFLPIKDHTLALWFIPKNHKPSQEEVKQKLNEIRQIGASPSVFNFKQKYSLEQFLAYSKTNEGH